jgi:hypothetical protein
MKNRNHDERHTHRPSRKRTQGAGRIHARVTIPPSPQWVEAKMADHPESSRLRLLAHEHEFDLVGWEPVGLSNLVCLTQPFLLPPPPGWKQVGFTVLHDEEIMVPDVGKLMSIRWQFALEWSPERSAWDALLFSLDHLDLKALALPPTYVLLTCFLACLADQPDEHCTQAGSASWRSVLAEACQALGPLLRALYEGWIDGPSRAAFKYRQYIEYIPPVNASSWHLFEPCRRLLGPAFVEAIRSSEHLEATVLRQLRQASTRLWTRGCIPLSGREIVSLLSTSGLSAVLPLALWQSPSPIKLDADMAQLHSLDDVLHLWKHHVALD